MATLLSRMGFPTTEEMKLRKAVDALIASEPDRPAITTHVVLHNGREVKVAVAVVAESAAVIAKPEPVSIPEASTTLQQPQLGDALRTRYMALADELGVQQPGLAADAARAYFKERGTRLYDGEKVKAYLNDQYGPAVLTDGEMFATWVWRPLRVRDHVIGGVNGYSAPSSNGVVWQRAEAYKKPIPLPVLLTAKEVAQQFPDALMFVSDELYKNERVIYDPFLLVVIGGEKFIIERWDEPAYRE